MVALAAATVSLPLGLPGSATAGCIAPQLRLAGERYPDGTAPEPRPTVRREAELTVEGRAFREGCDDTGGVDTFGCEEREAVAPLREVELRLEQRGRSWSLGTADAGPDHDVRWRVVLPDDVDPGPARLVTDAGSSEPLRVRVEGPAPG